MLLYNILVVPFSLTLGHIFIVIPAGVYPPLAEAGIQKGFNSKKEHKKYYDQRREHKRFDCRTLTIQKTKIK